MKECYNCGKEDTLWYAAFFRVWEWKWGVIPIPRTEKKSVCPQCYYYDIDYEKKVREAG